MRRGIIALLLGVTAPATALEPLDAEFCVSGGAPLVGEPVLDEQDRLFFTTSDGYLHAFEADGRYRFSYTVSGMPLGRVSLRPSDGTILLGTSTKLLYAIGPGGSLRWSAQILTPVASGIHPLNAGAVIFLGFDRQLYGWSTTGAVLFRVALSSAPLGEPVVSSSGAIWVPTARGLDRIEQKKSSDSIVFPEGVDELFPYAGGVVARAGRRALVLDAEGREIQRFSASRIGASEEALAWIDEQGDLKWLVEGRELQVALDDAALVSAALGVSAHEVVVPLVDGRVLFIDRQLKIRSERLIGERLMMPHPARRGWLVPSASGWICKLRS